MEAVTTQDINKSLLDQTGITLGNISRLNITLILACIYLFPHSKSAFTFFWPCVPTQLWDLCCTWDIVAFKKSKIIY